MQTKAVQMTRLETADGGMHAEHDDFYRVQSDGTTIMALKYAGGILLGADSRSSNDMYVADRCSDKLEPIHQRIYCQRSGTSSHTQTIAKYVRYYVDVQANQLNGPPAVESAAHIMKNIIYNNQGRLSASMICSGWDPYKGYQIYSVNQTGFWQDAPWALSGSGSTFIWGYFDHNYRPDFTLEEAREFVMQCISHACYRDGSSGGVIRMVSIQEEGTQRFYHPYQDFRIK